MKGCFFIVGVFALILCIGMPGYVKADNNDKSKDDKDADECDVSRDYIMIMTAVYVDKDNDNMISKHELQGIWDKVLTTNEKALASVAGSMIEPPSVIMDHCGGGEDGYISMKDFMTLTDTCLNKCWKLKTMNDKFLPRIKALLPPGSESFYEKRIKQKTKLLEYHRKHSNLPY